MKVSLLFASLFCAATAFADMTLAPETASYGPEQRTSLSVGMHSQLGMLHTARVSYAINPELRLGAGFLSSDSDLSVKNKSFEDYHISQNGALLFASYHPAGVSTNGFVAKAEYARSRGHLDFKRKNTQESRFTAAYFGEQGLERSADIAVQTASMGAGYQWMLNTGFYIDTLAGFDTHTLQLETKHKDVETRNLMGRGLLRIEANLGYRF